MKIDSSGKALGAYAPQAKPARRDETPAAARPAAPSENVAINPAASKMSAIEREIGTAPAFDSEKVAAIKAAITAGTFSVHPEKIADGLIASARELLS
ncbi:flagellar biosynthesis anti-sigma factor FlgM [Gulbenkiania mobilis]|uniref:Negative regulator of flagellin synthesis n=1 Tax=Gulbenkiania mobilis TaxID=397457 RepID=A0ABY2CZU5_GULMO|nr:FlgM family anti-sigma-28 factor [Gulbenkiania mobilis]